MFSPPREVKSTIAQIEIFLNDETFSYARSLVETNAKALVKEKTEKVIYSIRIEHKKPDHMALISIINVINILLPTGQYHIYRGALDAVGSGMLKIYDAAVNEFLVQGYTTEAEAEDDRKWIRHEIETVGWFLFSIS